MSLPKLLSTLLLILTVSHAANAKTPNSNTIVLSSPVEQATLVELYTSEGCSSCPPADRWLSKLKTHKDLWQKIVPLSFHVDYWNYLGWRDQFSDARYSKRQYNYKKHNYLDVVYTPGLVKNGREFRGWNQGRNILNNKTNKVGILKAEISGDSANIEFIPAKNLTTTLTLNIALLAFDQKIEVTAGENGGHLLVHDFVVRDYRQHEPKVAGKNVQWTLDDLNQKNLEDVSGIALWVTAGNDPTPIQATGGWLR